MTGKKTALDRLEDLPDRKYLAFIVPKRGWVRRLFDEAKRRELERVRKEVLDRIANQSQWKYEDNLIQGVSDEQGKNRR